MKRIVYTRADGGVTVVTPAYNSMLDGETEGDFLTRIKERAVPAGALNVHICDAASIPADRTFRSAWEQGGNKLLTVNMPKARNIQRDRIRAARAGEFVKNDIAINDALLTGSASAKDATLARRDELRNATEDAAIEAATTPEELAIVSPAGLVLK